MKSVRNAMWIGLAGLLTASFGVSAAEKPLQQSGANPASSQVLVVAKPTKRGGALVSVEYYSDGRAVGVNVDLELGDLQKAAPQLAGCSSGSQMKAGANWAGGCSMVDGVVRFVYVNTSLEPLPKGWHTLGTFKAASVPASGITARTAVAGDAQSKQLPVGYEFSWVE